MVHYSIDTDPRPKVYFYIAGVAILVAVGVSHYLELGMAKVAVPSAFSLFAVLTLLFDRVLWRLRPFSLLADVPNLNGLYRGHVDVLEQHPSSAEHLPATVTITQTWSKVELVLETESTVSYLRTCGFFVESRETCSMLYTFLVRDKRPSGTKNFYGEGTIELYFQGSGPDRLEGPYYSTKARRGTVSIQR